MARGKQSGCVEVLGTGCLVVIVVFVALIGVAYMWDGATRAGRERELADKVRQYEEAVAARRQVEAVGAAQGGDVKPGTSDHAEVATSGVVEREEPEGHVEDGVEALWRVLEERAGELDVGGFVELAECGGAKVGDPVSSLAERFGRPDVEGVSDDWVIGDLWPGRKVYGYCDGRVVFVSTENGWDVETVLAAVEPLISRENTRWAAEARHRAYAMRVAAERRAEPGLPKNGRSNAGTVVTVKDGTAGYGGMYNANHAEVIAASGQGNLRATILVVEVDNRAGTLPFAFNPSGNWATDASGRRFVSFPASVREVAGLIPNEAAYALTAGVVHPGQTRVFLMTFPATLVASQIMKVEVVGPLSTPVTCE